MNEIPVRATGRITRILKPELYEVRLPNGKLTLGHLSRPLRSSGQLPVRDSLVELELTPFDFDSARISALVPGQD